MDPANASKQSYTERWREEPIQPKQKALLEFLKMPVPPTRGGASNLIKAVFEGPAGNAHQKAWDAVKYTLHPDLYPPASKKALPSARPPFFRGALKAVIIFAVIFYAVDSYIKQAISPPTGNESAVPTQAPPETVISIPIPSAPETKPIAEILLLKSTDGRTISAKVLAFTKESVVIRREDGETFDLRLDRLTAESQLKIAEYRAAKRAGRVK